MFADEVQEVDQENDETRPDEDSGDAPHTAATVRTGVSESKFLTVWIYCLFFLMRACYMIAE